MLRLAFPGHLISRNGDIPWPQISLVHQTLQLQLSFVVKREREREEMLDRARHSIQPLCDNETRGSSPSLLSLPERLRRSAFHRFLNSGSKQTLAFGVCCSLLLHYTLHDASVRHACKLTSLTPEEVARTSILAAQ